MMPAPISTKTQLYWEKMATRRSSVEAGLALVEKRGNAFEAFRRGALRGDGLALQHHLRFERAERARNEPLRATERPGRSRGQLLSHRDRFGQELRIGHDAIHEPPVPRFFGIDRAI